MADPLAFWSRRDQWLSRALIVLCVIPCTWVTPSSGRVRFCPTAPRLSTPVSKAVYYRGIGGMAGRLQPGVSRLHEADGGDFPAGVWAGRVLMMDQAVIEDVTSCSGFGPEKGAAAPWECGGLTPPWHGLCRQQMTEGGRAEIARHFSKRWDLFGVASCVVRSRILFLKGRLCWAAGRCASRTQSHDAAAPSPGPTASTPLSRFQSHFR